MDDLFNWSPGLQDKIVFETLVRIPVVALQKDTSKTAVNVRWREAGGVELGRPKPFNVILQ